MIVKAYASIDRNKYHRLHQSIGAEDRIGTRDTTTIRFKMVCTVDAGLVPVYNELF